MPSCRARDSSTPRPWVVRRSTRRDPDQHRRTIYSRVSRLELNPMLALFDFPDPNAHSEHRVRTTTPLQKLFVLNSPFLIHQADALADRLRDEVGHDPEGRIRRAYHLLYRRGPSEREIVMGMAYLGDDPESQEGRWSSYAQALLASNETLFLD